MIEHVGNIKSSFDAALNIMRLRVEAIRADFSDHQEDMMAEKEDKEELKKEHAEAVNRQTKAEERLGSLAASFEASSAQHATDINMLQRDMEASIEQAKTIGDALAAHTEETAAALEDLSGKVDGLRRDILGRLEDARVQSEQYADRAAERAKAEVMEALKAAQRDSGDQGKVLKSITDDLDDRLKGRREREREADRPLSPACDMTPALGKKRDR